MEEIIGIDGENFFLIGIDGLQLPLFYYGLEE